MKNDKIVNCAKPLTAKWVQQNIKFWLHAACMDVRFYGKRSKLKDGFRLFSGVVPTGHSPNN